MVTHCGIINLIQSEFVDFFHWSEQVRGGGIFKSGNSLVYLWLISANKGIQVFLLSRRMALQHGFWFPFQSTCKLLQKLHYSSFYSTNSLGFELTIDQRIGNMKFWKGELSCLWDIQIVNAESPYISTH